jgi:hypothetical protein
MRPYHNTHNGMGIYGKLCIYRGIIIYPTALNAGIGQGDL